MVIYLVYGPTCTGKTSVAINIARKTRFPVIALDRVQCCPQVATGSGRPLLSELQSTERIYLASRDWEKGIISAEMAHAQLVREIQQRREQAGVIIEGGSISMLNCMAQDDYWASGFSWKINRLKLGQPEQFLHRAARRVAEMLTDRDDRASLLTELVTLWKIPKARKFLQDIDGYRYAIRFAQHNNLPIEQLPDMSTEQKLALIEGIAQEYLQHAQWQEKDFPAHCEGGSHPFEDTPALRSAQRK